MRHGIKVFAPATVANVGCGFDILGFALQGIGDEVVVRFSDKKKLEITIISGAQKKLTRDVHQNTAGFGALKLLEFLGESGRGIEMEIHKKMPIGSGLGSSAASAVAGVFAVNELLNRPLEKKELLRFALDGEELVSGARHADNVAPSLLGGFLFIRNHEELDIFRLPVPHGLFITVLYPHVEILTKESRKLLSETVSLKQHVEQSANLAGLINSLYRFDLDLLGRSLRDVIIEPQRAGMIPYFYDIQRAALENGALGCSISGSGPSIFAVSHNSLIAENVAEGMKAIYEKNKIEYTLYMSSINQEGAKKF